MEKAAAGEPLRISATQWNAIVDATDAYQRTSPLGAPVDPGGLVVPTTLCKIKNDSGADRSRGHVLEITGYLPTTFDRRYLWFTGGSPSPAIDKRYAIAKRAVKSSSIVEAQIAGMCAALVNITDSAHKTCTIASATYVLQSSVNGPIPIYYQPSGTGEKECVVVLPAVILYKPLIRFTLSAALATSDASKTGTIATQYGPGLASPSTGAGAVTLHNLLTSTGGVYLFEGASGKAGYADWDSGVNYRITQMECP